MILSLGEILVDMLQDGDCYQRFLGGAPFNVAVYAKRAGAKVGFVGRVGKDSFGKFLIEKSKIFGLDELFIQTDEKRNTTLAFVFLEKGERDFAFFRNDTADYNITVNEIDFSRFQDLNIINLGSLMLSTAQGVKTAEEVVRKTKDIGAKLSFDVNYRADIFRSVEEAREIFAPIIDKADILKFSIDEIKLFAMTDDLDEALVKFNKKDRLLVVTMGSEGSLCYYNGNKIFAKTIKVDAIDTTGAGDAFWGTFLACIEKKSWTEENVLFSLEKANEIGAKTTQHHGAIKY